MTIRVESWALSIPSRPGGKPMKKILVGLDGSDESAGVLGAMRRLAGPDMSIVLLTVLSVPGYSPLHPVDDFTWHWPGMPAPIHSPAELAENRSQAIDRMR